MLKIKAGETANIHLDLVISTSVDLLIDDNDFEAIKSQIKAYLLGCKDFSSNVQGIIYGKDN